MNDLIAISYDADTPTVSGRELHKALCVESNYTTWLKRMCEYGFTENVDYTAIFQKWNTAQGNETTQTDHQLTIPMAKEICMLQRSDKGKQFRQYFLKVEEAWNSPEMIMKRALDIANASVKKLQLTVSELTVDNQIMKPKADYFDELVDRNLLTNFRETAKQLEVREKDFISFLVEKKYIYRTGKGKLMPYADKNDGLFEIKETFNEKTSWSGTQTLITPKGRETFRLLYLKVGGEKHR